MNNKMINYKVKEKLEPSDRIKRLIARADRYYKEERRAQYVENTKKMIYQWRPKTKEYAEKLGFPYGNYDIAHGDIRVGDFLCQVKSDKEFPGGKFPSEKHGFSWDPINWAQDYDHLLKYNGAEICPDEKIVGEIHWILEEFRNFEWPSEVDPLGAKAVELGAGGWARSHTCVDLDYGLKKGWSGVLQDIRKRKNDFEKTGGRELEYLQAFEMVVISIMAFIKNHSKRANELAENETDEEAKANYLEISRICEKISDNPPDTFREALQWVWFYVLADRVMTHANGYGRLDQVLKDYYFKDIEDERLSRDEARDLIAELWIKYSGTYFSLGGRDQDLNDATNELSWVCLEAFDMIGGMNTFGVMWHSDINKEFYEYACDVLARLGQGAPALLNYDVMRQSFINSGVREEDAWNLAYTGCHWYCLIGKEYSLHDTSEIILVKCLLRALKAASQKPVNEFDELFEILKNETTKAAKAMKMLTDAQCRLQPLIWPELVSSVLMPTCIEKGRDVTDCGVPYNSSTVNIVGFANVVDSLYAIKKYVFEEKRITIQELLEILKNDYEEYEDLRQSILHLPKYGEDNDEVNEMVLKVVKLVKDLLGNMKNCKGFAYRPSIFSWMNHVYAGPEMGATPDGRKKEEPLAQSPDPMHGRNREGLTATAKSLALLGFDGLVGGSWHMEIDPSIFRGSYEDKHFKLVEDISTSYFKLGGVHIVLNIVSRKELEKALAQPENYGHLIVRVTGQPAHFVNLDRKIQEEIIERTRPC
ncbi:MAG: pyruvate formate lyase family protein [Atribacterota bacterium]|nr:pyruvate formate lyase family protein [Atribacterota bacterium]